MRISQSHIRLKDLISSIPGARATLRHSEDVVWDNQVPREVIRACPSCFRPITSATSLVIPPHLDCSQLNTARLNSLATCGCRNPQHSITLLIGVGYYHGKARMNGFPAG